MRRADPFTTDSARVVDPAAPTDAQLQREADAVLCDAWQIFGKLGQLKYLKYFGEEGRWRCGFTSFYGFHARGFGTNARAAVEMAKRSRLPDDPSPLNPSWVPGSFKSPYDPYLAKPLTVDPSPRASASGLLTKFLAEAV
jgi:hypothetical protein